MQVVRLRFVKIKLSSTNTLRRGANNFVLLQTANLYSPQHSFKRYVLYPKKSSIDCGRDFLGAWDELSRGGMVASVREEERLKRSHMQSTLKSTTSAI